MLKKLLASRAVILFASVLVIMSLWVRDVKGIENIWENSDLLEPIGETFTYQGRIATGSTPIDGTCDFSFGLWDAASGGTQVGGDLIVSGVVINQGYFLVPLNFGTGAFNGQGRWLEIAVRCPPDLSYTMLGRQEITATPYSLYSLDAGLLSGRDAAFFQNASNINTGLLDPDNFDAYDDIYRNGYLFNSTGDIAQNNGILQTSLNADLLDGYHLSSLQMPINGSCPLGTYIKSINTNGSVNCQANPIINRFEPPTNNTYTVLDSEGIVGWNTNVTIGSDGLPLISYADFLHGNLKVAHCSNIKCTSATITMLDSDGDEGSVIAIGSDGLGIIAYMGTSFAGVKLAHCSNLECTSATISTVDPQTTGVGGITIGSDGFPLIVYLKEGLKVAHCSDLNCSSATKTIIDPSQTAHIGIITGSDGLGLISYWKGGAGLAVAHCSNVNCTSATLTTLEDVGNTGYFTTITLGIDGLGLISYQQDTGLNMKIAHCTNVLCDTATLSTIKENTNVGSRSITIGADGLGIISAEDGLGDGMFFAHCNDILCSSATFMKLDAGRISKSSSITIGIDGLPLISYLDFDDGDLKVVHCADPLCIPYFRRR